MLLALLYDENEQVVAAAPACDQQPYGEGYWSEIFPGQLQFKAEYQVGYVNVDDRELCDRALLLSIEFEPSRELTNQLEQLAVAPRVSLTKAA